MNRHDKREPRSQNKNIYCIYIFGGAKETFGGAPARHFSRSVHNCVSIMLLMSDILCSIFVPDSCRADTDRYDPSFSGLRIATTSRTQKTSQTLPHYITFFLEQYSMPPDTMPT